MEKKGNGDTFRTVYFVWVGLVLSSLRFRLQNTTVPPVPSGGTVATVPLSGRIGRSSTVTEIVTNLKQDRPKQNRWIERQRRYLSFPYSTPPRIAKLGPGERSARVGRTSCRVGHGLSFEPVTDTPPGPECCDAKI